MRIKTVPRQRVIHSNTRVESEEVAPESEGLKDCPPKHEETQDTSNCTTDSSNTPDNCKLINSPPKNEEPKETVKHTTDSLDTPDNNKLDNSSPKNEETKETLKSTPDSLNMSDNGKLVNSSTKNEETKETVKYTTCILKIPDNYKLVNFIKFENPESSASIEAKTETANHAIEVLDMSDKCKVQPLQKSLPNRYLKTGTSNWTYDDFKYPDFPSKEVTTKVLHSDDNNNALPSHTGVINFYSSAGPSSGKYAKLSCQDNAKSLCVKEEDTMKAVNLCKKDSQVEEDAPSTQTGCDDKFKDTFLYKIMTDPTFLESIQKNKQSRKYTCHFCKQEFVNGDDLADHMDVKTDESNQVVCCACKKTFAQKRYLRYHQRCHSERSKFTCDICTKKYTRMDNLTRHNAFHVNPDKFSCTFCDRTFARKDLLNKHVKCHDNKYRFYCDTCQKYFKGPLTLDNHNKIFHSVA